MKKAIVYYSMSGNTEYVAKYVSSKIDADLIKIEPKKEYPNKGLKKFLWGGKSAVMGEKPELENYEFGNYDLIVFVSPVWAGTFAPPIRTFVNDNTDKLNGNKFAVIMCQSGAGGEKAIEKLKSLLNTEKLEQELVLIDPKDKKSEEKDKKIYEFCENIKQKKSL